MGKFSFVFNILSLGFKRINYLDTKRECFLEFKVICDHFWWIFDDIFMGNGSYDIEAHISESW